MVDDAAALQIMDRLKKVAFVPNLASESLMVSIRCGGDGPYWHVPLQEGQQRALWRRVSGEKLSMHTMLMRQVAKSFKHDMASLKRKAFARIATGARTFPAVSAASVDADDKTHES